MTVNLTDPIFTDEDKARAYFEEIRWPNGVTCPHCGNANSARIYSIARQCREENPSRVASHAKIATGNSPSAPVASWKAAMFR